MLLLVEVAASSLDYDRTVKRDVYAQNGIEDYWIVNVTERQKSLLRGRGRYHPDRIAALIHLAAVENALGKCEECERVAEEALEAFAIISTREHPLAKKLRADREEWRRSRSESGDLNGG